MQFRDIKLAITIVSLLVYSGSTLANSASPRTCSTDYLHQNTVPTGGSGGTGHDPATPPGGIGGTGNTVPPGGIGGNGIEAAAETGGIGGTGNIVPPGGIGGNGIEATLDSSGIGGTGNTVPVPPGGIGGTGITTAGIITKASGSVVAIIDAGRQLRLAEGDEVCTGDKIIAAENSQAKITFSDGALLHVLQNTEINIVDYYYASTAPEQSRSVVSLQKGDIRSVSGAISKINPEQYAIKTPAATIRVVGTDFLVTHLPENNEGMLTGTYTKVISGEVNVISKLTKILLRAGESSHVLLNGIQSIIKSSGGTCILP